MEERREKQVIKAKRMVCFCLFVMVILLCGKVEAYKNYTVGDSLGWYDNLVKPDVDYDQWVSGKTFSLGDFLLFNTDNNHSVVQTHDYSTYKSCDTQSDHTILWSTIDPNSTSVQSVTVAVPLVKQGPNYFFSGDYDGEQCMNGQKFQINVTHGHGLPPSLRDNPEFAASGPTPAANVAPGPVDPESGDDQSVPETMVPANFDHPKKLPEDSTDGGDEESDTNKTNDASVVNVAWSLLGFFVGLLMLFWAC